MIDNFCELDDMEKFLIWLSSGKDKKYYEEWMEHPFVVDLRDDKPWCYDDVDNGIMDDDCEFFYAIKDDDGESRVSNLAFFNPPDEEDEDEEEEC